MDKKYAFVLSILLTLIIFSNFFIFSAKENQRESVIVSRVIDWDTLETENGYTIRLLNVNSPEKGTFHAQLSKDYLKSFENKTIEIEIQGTDKYKRILARLYAPDYVNLELVSQGLASKFLVDESELKTFAQAEEKAVQNSKGMWNKSLYYGCFSSDINKYQEFVILENHCEDTNMKGWVLKDESRKSYIFSSSFKSVILYSGLGEDNSTDLFIGSKTDIWNNDRDTLYLFDSGGNIVYHEAYGY